jgi:hypothetical protein
MASMAGVDTYMAAVQARNPPCSVQYKCNDSDDLDTVTCLLRVLLFEWKFVYPGSFQWCAENDG